MRKPLSINGFSPRFKTVPLVLGTFGLPVSLTVLHLFSCSIVSGANQSNVPVISLPAANSQVQTQSLALDRELTQLTALVNDGALMSARPKVESLIARNAQDVRVALLAARLYQKMGLSTLAIIQYEKVRRSSPRMLEPLIALSRMHLENLSSNLAVQLAEDAVSIDGKSKEARLALVDALIANQSMRRARLQSEQLAQLYPNDSEVQHALYMVAMAYGEEEQALTYLKPAAEGQKKPSWLLELAGLYQSLHRYSQARDVYQQMLQDDAANLEALVGLAHLYEFDLGDYMSAIATYRKIIEIFPDDTGAHAGIERCMGKQADLALWVKGSIYRLFGWALDQDGPIKSNNETTPPQ
ncbi:MAG: tetratricopeptide repeat protein [Candidatus Obscuribacter sp.]|nr:tetratricopeptide repeat protein [Candidatus Obscuribacter sp.]MBK7839497.1 tetratricopeptide repeat protein [Candidatus Obscuribacter sp.]MBK9619017.1 tetratricopeptide repeat protein [Candidatus Obscuribacter sp.]